MLLSRKSTGFFFFFRVMNYTSILVMNECAHSVSYWCVIRISMIPAPLEEFYMVDNGRYGTLDLAK